MTGYRKFTWPFLIIIPVIASCSAIKSGSPVKAGFEVEEKTWASKYIPGVNKLSEMLPPPTDARTKWDQWQKKRTETPGGNVTGF